MKLVQAFVCAVTLLGGGLVAKAIADGCYNCGSGSPCNQCRYGNDDTFDKRKVCQSNGCKITATSSCSTAANVKVCSVADVKNSNEVIAWTLVSSIN